MTFEDTAILSQPMLKKALVSELARFGYAPQDRKGFIYAQGKVPVLLVAHMDTVHKERIRTICYSNDRNIVMSPQGIGGDDRAGIFMVMKIIKKHRCHVLFCEDEEIGGIGAHEFAASGIKPQVNYIVGLDRRGSDDAVFYDCDNPEFTKFVTGFGFKEKFGSFSDISIVAPALKIAAVNLSAGFYNEHTKHEHVNMKDITNNIKRVSKMAATKTETFEYMEGASDDCFSWLALHGLTNHGRIHDKSRLVPLMPLDASFYIRNENGEYEDCADEEYMINSSGNVYKYLFELYAAITLPSHSALTESGMHACYDEEYAMDTLVVADDALDACYWETYGENRTISGWDQAKKMYLFSRKS